VPAAIAVQPGALAELRQHRQVGLLPGVVLGYVMPAHAGAIVMRFAAPGKPRGLVAPPVGPTYILSVPASPPKFVRPCIPTAAKAIPKGDDWLHEPKLDGYRFQVVKDGSALRLYSRSGASRAWQRRWRAFSARPQ
jgi:hypothetical protein